MSSQLFFRDKGKIWRYNVDNKGADSNPSSMRLLISEANGAIRYKRLVKTLTATIHRRPNNFKSIIGGSGPKGLKKSLEKRRWQQLCFPE